MLGWGQMGPQRGTPEWAEAEERRRENDIRQKEHELAMKNAGRPDRPEWESQLGKDGLLKGNLQLDSGGLQTGFLDRMRTEGLRDPGSQSAWGALANQQIDRQQLSQRDQLGRQQAGQMGQAINNLAMQGGIRGSAGERMAGRMANQGLMQQQQMARQAGDQRMNVSMQDEQNRLRNLSNLGQAEMGVAGFNQGTQKYNIGNALQENLAKRAADVNFYNEDMRAWAAERTAAATPSGGGGKK